jgi:hypothetical protein
LPYGRAGLGANPDREWGTAKFRRRLLKPANQARTALLVMDFTKQTCRERTVQFGAEGGQLVAEARAKGR